MTILETCNAGIDTWPKAVAFLGLLGFCLVVFWIFFRIIGVFFYDDRKADEKDD